MSDLPTSIPLGSWILVTGASGFLASHIIIQFLQRGFKVRGAVRDPNQSSWLLEGRFKSYAESGALELVAVQDLGADGAYDEAMKGMTAVAHTAYVTDIVPDPNKVITPLVNSVRSIFNAALHEPSVKEVLLTSGATAATPLDQKTDNGTVTRDTWNDAVLEVAWAPPPYGMSHAMANYTASKTASEKEFWKLVEGKDLPFNVNVVAPAGIIGEPLHPKHVGGPASWIVHAYRGNKTWMDPMPASFYAEVKDLALLHVAAILDPNVKHARLQSWGHSTHYNEVLAVLRKLRPQKQFVDDYPETYHIKVSVDQSDAVALLTKWSGKPDRDGWTPLEDSIRDNIDTSYLED